MDHYLDIEILPDPEFDTTTLMNALYSKLHRALTKMGSDQIGVSFPHSKKTPGELLRVHASKVGLEQLMRQNWLKGLHDYTKISAISCIPFVMC